MKIDGRAIADGIFGTLSQRALKPTLAVILVGDNPDSLAYIRQKKKAVERIGGRFIFEHLPKTTTQEELSARVDMYNHDLGVHALIVQRPIPTGLTAKVDLLKDIDGFEKGSPYHVPVAMAIFTILEHIHVDYHKKNIVIIGRGETAGRPIAASFAKGHCATSVIFSQTPNPKEIMRSADILISCVGKPRVVAAGCVKPGAVVIGVGISTGPDGKLHGDYDEEEIKNIAGFYTPTPGGVGPVNIACLIQNLVVAAQKMTH